MEINNGISMSGGSINSGSIVISPTSSIINTNGPDMETLAKELAMLYSAMQREPKQKTDEHAIAMDAVKEAKEAAKNGNHSKVLEYLSKAGKWALDTATTIGVSVATTALKSAISAT